MSSTIYNCHFFYQIKKIYKYNNTKIFLQNIILRNFKFNLILQNQFVRLDLHSPIF